jgi:hypothetical protein
VRGERSGVRDAVAAKCEPEPVCIEAAKRRTSAEWALVASSLLRAVSGASDRGCALDACQAAANEVRVRGDALQLGNELAAVAKRSSDRRGRSTAQALATCFWQSAVVVDPMLFWRTLALMAAAIAGALVAFALGEAAIAIVACVVAIALLDRTGVLVYRGRHADWSEPIVPPTREVFLNLGCIRMLPDGQISGG